MMSIRAFVVATLFCLVASQLATAQEKSDQSFAEAFAGDAKKMYSHVVELVDEAEVEAEREADEESPDVVSVYENTTVTIKADRSYSETVHQVSFVSSRAGIETASALSRRWTPWYQDKPEITARVISPRGSEAWLDASTLAEASFGEVDYGIYTDDRAMEGVLPNVRRGSVIEKVFRVDQSRPFCEAGVIYQRSLYRYQRPIEWKLTFICPKSLPFKYMVAGDQEVRETRTEQGDNIVVELTIDQENEKDGDGVDKGRTFEVNAGPDTYQFPKIVVSTQDSWGPITDYYHSQIEEVMSGQDYNQFVETLDTQGMDSDAIVSEVLAIVQDRVRYTGFEFGIRAIIPNDSKVVWERGLGDCKDQSTLMVGILRKLGVDAHVALLKSGYGVDLASDHPGLNAFNHAIVYIPGEKPYWVDPTATFYPAGTLPVADTNRYALIIKPGNDQLVKIPRAKKDKNRQTTKRVVKLHEVRDGDSTYEIESHGIFAAAERASFDYATPGKMRRAFSNRLKTNEGYSKVDEVVVSPLDDYQRPFSVSYSAAGGKLIERYQNEVKLSVTSDLFEQDLPSGLLSQGGYSFRGFKDGDSGTRTNPFVFPKFFATEWSFVIEPPPGFEVVTLPKPIDISVADFRYQISFEELESGVVDGKVVVDTGDRDLTASECQEVRDQYRRVAGSALELPLNVLLKDSSFSLIEKGKYKKSFKELESLEQAYDQPWQYQLRKARWLRKVGLGLAARDVARQVAEEFPDHDAIQAAYGEELCHNEVGQLFGEGYDRAGAIKQFEKAIELDDEDYVYHWFLAQLSMRNYHAVFTQDREAAKESIKHYRKAVRLGFKPDYMQLYHVATQFLASRDLSGLHKEFERNELSHQSLPVVAAAKALAGGAESAVREIDSYSLEEYWHEKSLMVTARTLTFLGEPELAIELTEIIPKSNQFRSYIDKDAERYKDVRPDEIKRFAEDDPRYPIQASLDVLCSADGRSSSTTEYFVKGTQYDDIEPMLRRWETRPSYVHSVDTEQVTDISRVLHLQQQLGGLEQTGRHWLSAPAGKSGAEARKTFQGILPFLVAYEDGKPKLVPRGQRNQNWGDYAFSLLTDDLHENDELAYEILDQVAKDEPRVAQIEATPFLKLYEMAKEEEDADARFELSKLVAASRSKATNDEASEWLHSRQAFVDSDIEVQICRALTQLHQIRNEADKAIEAAERATELAGKDYRTWAYFLLERYDKALETLHAEYAVATETSIINYRHFGICCKQGKWDEARKARRRYEGKGLLASWFSKSPDSSRLTNQLVWCKLFSQKPSSADVSDMEKLVGDANQTHSSAEHTLAAAYAVRNQPAKAIEAMKHNLDLKQPREYSRNDDVVMGRIAQSLGLTEEARFYYRRCMEVEKPTSYDCDDLSRIWLAELDSSSVDVENVPSNSDGDQPKK